jgi:hypothetical protein
MKIAVLTEGQYIGKVQRDHPHMRTDLAWICALQADHIPIVKVHEIENEYDLGVFILPKKLEQIAGYLEQVDYKSKFKKIAFMQEGPQTFFQDYHINLQFWYYDFLQNVDYIFTHNFIDQNYYKGLTNKPTHILQSLLIEDPLKDLEIKTYDQRTNSVIIGGNFSQWYSGFIEHLNDVPTKSPMPRKLFASKTGGIGRVQSSSRKNTQPSNALLGPPFSFQ